MPDFFPSGTNMFSSTPRNTLRAGRLVPTIAQPPLPLREKRIAGPWCLLRTESMSDGNIDEFYGGGYRRPVPALISNRRDGPGACLCAVLTLSMENDMQMEVAPEFASLRQSTIVVKEPRNSTELSDASHMRHSQSSGKRLVAHSKHGKASADLNCSCQSGTGTTPLFTVAYSQANGGFRSYWRQVAAPQPGP